MHKSARVQEGTEPIEKPADLVKELDTYISRLEYLVVHINRTNENCRATTGETIAELIAKRDALEKKLSMLGTMIEEGSSIIGRATRSEIRILPAFDVKKLQTEIDKLSKKLREVDTRLQESNWLVDLIE